MSKLHIAVDMDDVVLDFFPSVLRSFEAEYGIRVPYDGHPWGADARRFTKHPAFLASGYEDWWGWLRDREWLWALFPAVPGAVGGIKQLRAAGHYVECVTSKPEWAEHNVWKWLGKWRPPFNQVTIVTNGQSKVDFTDADLMVDDKQETIEAFRDAGRVGVLFDRSPVPTTVDGTYTARDWTDVVDIVGEVWSRQSGILLPRS